MKINNQNKTINLINYSEVNMLRTPGLTDIDFDLLLPNVKYPFARYESGFQNAKYYLDILENLKTEKKPFLLKIIRTFPSGKALYNTDDMKVSLEDYDIVEDAKEGFDVTVGVKLKQYRDYGTKKAKITDENTASTENKRSTDNSPEPKTNQSYTVKSGDCLWNLAKKYYGDGSKYNLIFEANKDKISNPNLIYPGQVLTIPNSSQAQSSSASSGSKSSGSSSASSSKSSSGGSVSSGTSSSGTSSNNISSQQYTLTVTADPGDAHYGGTITMSYFAPLMPNKAITSKIDGYGSRTLNLAKDSTVTFIVTAKTGYTYKVLSSSGSWNRSMTSWTYKADKKSGSITISWVRK